jgi:hypothetical protein
LIASFSALSAAIFAASAALLDPSRASFVAFARVARRRRVATRVAVATLRERAAVVAPRALAIASSRRRGVGVCAPRPRARWATRSDPGLRSFSYRAWLV